MTDPVIHNQSQHRFELQFEGALAVCEYKEQGKAWHFTHTEVPESLRGKGIAARLASAALDEALAQGKTVVPLCSYISTFIARNAKYQVLLRK